MKFPTILPIARMEDYHTHYLGQCSDGRLFWAYETFFYSKSLQEIQNNEWKKYRKEYALLHTFDKAGNYLDTAYVYAGTSEETGGVPLENEIEKLVATLGEVEYKDIEVKLFQTIIDGYVFGLVADEETGMIDLEPGSLISFMEPWDGEYYT